MDISQQTSTEFNREAVARYSKVFKKFDTNQNGVLEASELEAVSKVLGYRLPKEVSTKLMKMMDIDDQGTLTFEQFLTAMPGYEKAIPEQEQRKAKLRRKFQKFDENGDGFISKDEAHAVLSRELAFTVAQTNELVKQFDVNFDGKLSYEEFVGFFIKVKEKKDEIKKLFKEFDRDNKGYVSMEDAQRILRQLSFDETEVVFLVNAHDTNKDGKLQYDEFVHFWCK